MVQRSIEISKAVFSDTDDDSGRFVVRLERDLKCSYCFDSPSSTGKLRFWIRVPKGFTTDFASIPRVLWFFMSPYGRWRTAAVFHDWLCDMKVDRFIGDTIFRNIMRETGVDVYHRVLIYYSVRAYWVFWGKWKKSP